MCICFIDLVTRHANRIFSTQHNIGLAGLADRTTFFHIILETAQFSEKNIENKMCCDFFYNVCLKDSRIILRRIQSDIVIVYIGLHVKYPLFKYYFNSTKILWTKFQRIFQYHIS